MHLTKWSTWTTKVVSKKVTKVVDMTSSEGFLVSTVFEHNIGASSQQCMTQQCIYISSYDSILSISKP